MGTVVLTMWSPAVERFKAYQPGSSGVCSPPDGVKTVRKKGTFVFPGSLFACQICVPHGESACRPVPGLMQGTGIQ